MAAPPRALLAAPEITEPAHGFTTDAEVVHLAGTVPDADYVQVHTPHEILDVDVTADGRFATDVSLPDEREYTLRVRAVKGLRRSDWVDVVLTREPAVVPGLPAPAPRPVRTGARPTPAGDDEAERRSWWDDMPTPLKVVILVVVALVVALLAFWFVRLIIGAANSPSGVPASVGAGVSQEVPSAPGSLTATPGASQITLSWTPPSSGHVNDYVIKRDGNTIATQSGTTFTDQNVTPGTSYNYTVQAQGPAGTISDPASATVTAQGAAASGSSATPAPANTAPAQVVGGTGPIAISAPPNHAVHYQAQIFGTGALPTNGHVLRLFVFAPGEGLYHPQGVAQVASGGWTAGANFGACGSGDIGATFTLYAVELTASQNDDVNKFHEQKLGGNPDAGYSGEQWQNDFSGGIKDQMNVVRVGSAKC